MTRFLLGGDAFYVDNTALNAWLPSRNRWSRGQGEELVEGVGGRLSAHGHTNISSDSARKAIKGILDTLTRQRYPHASGYVKDTLRKLMQDDMYSTTTASGLRAGRQRFLVLACLARYTHSYPLASAITSFLSENILDVVQYESPYYFREWSQALNELQGIVPDPMLQHLIAQLTGRGHSNWSPHKWYDSDTMRMAKAIEAAQCYPRAPSPRLLGPPLSMEHWRPSSAPGYRYPRIQSPEWRLNRWCRSAWSSPIIKPRIPDYYDEGGYEALAVEQECQAAEMDDINRRLERLENSPHNSPYDLY